MNKVLLVEDDQMLLDMYVDLLKGEGFDVQVATDGNAGLALAAAGGFDVVLLDFHLPGKDAFGILEELAKTPPAVPNKNLLMLTNIDQDQATTERAKSLGVEKILMKSSLNPAQFVAEVKACLATH